jgi:hypothetical protein
MLMTAVAICAGTAVHRSPKRLVLGVLVHALFPFVHLLLELLGLLLVAEGQSSQAVLEFEGVEEDAVLVVREGVVYFLVPYDATVGRRDVHELDPYCVSHQVVGQHSGALQSSICPSVPVRVGNVQFGHSDGKDLVRGLGHSALDRHLVVVSKDGRHGGKGCGSPWGRPREEYI